MAPPRCHDTVLPCRPPHARHYPAPPSAAHADGTRPRTLPLQGWGRSPRPPRKPAGTGCSHAAPGSTGTITAIPRGAECPTCGHSSRCPGGTGAGSVPMHHGPGSAACLATVVPRHAAPQHAPVSPQQDQELPSWVSPPQTWGSQPGSPGSCPDRPPTCSCPTAMPTFHQLSPASAAGRAGDSMNPLVPLSNRPGSPCPTEGGRYGPAAAQGQGQP